MQLLRVLVLQNGLEHTLPVGSGAYRLGIHTCIYIYNIHIYRMTLILTSSQFPVSATSKLMQLKARESRHKNKQGTPKKALLRPQFV